MKIIHYSLLVLSLFPQSVNNNNVNKHHSIVNLWVPQDSDIYMHYNLQEEYFGSYPEWALLLLKSKSGDIMTPTALPQALDAMNTINNITSESDGKIYAYSDFCAKVDISSPICVSSQVNLFTMFFEDNEAYYTNEDYINGVLNTDGVDNFVGGLEYDESGNVVTGGEYIRIFYELISTTDEEFDEAMGEWQAAFEEFWGERMNDYSEFEVIFVTFVSLDSELARTVTEDSVMFAIAFCVMLVYLQLTLGSFTCVRARVLLATSSVLLYFVHLLPCVFTLNPSNILYN